MKLEMKQSKKKSKSVTKYETNQSGLGGGVASEKLKEKYETKLVDLQKEFEREKDELQLKCNVLMQNNKELNERNDLLSKEIANLQDGFNEYIKNQENIDHSIMKINPNDESTLTINKSLLTIFDGNEIKNAEDFENFLQNLSLTPNDQDAVNRYWKKQKARMDKESRWINKLKRIINELLSNYQKLIEKELPDLQEHHDMVLESLKENEVHISIWLVHFLHGVLVYCCTFLNRSTARQKFPSSFKLVIPSFRSNLRPARQEIRSFRRMIPILLRRANWWVIYAEV